MTSSAETDFDLMQRIAADQELAIEQLYDRFGSLVYRMAYQTMPSRADADDVVQEVFVRLWRTADRYDPKRAALVTWVMLIARRHMVDRLRRYRSSLKPSKLEEGWSPASEQELEPGLGLEQNERFKAVMERIESEQPDRVVFEILRGYDSSFKFAEPNWKPIELENPDDEQEK